MTVASRVGESDLDKTPEMRLQAKLSQVVRDVEGVSAVAVGDAHGLPIASTAEPGMWSSWPSAKDLRSSSFSPEAQTSGCSTSSSSGFAQRFTRSLKSSDEPRARPNSPRVREAWRGRRKLRGGLDRGGAGGRGSRGAWTVHAGPRIQTAQNEGAPPSVKNGPGGLWTEDRYEPD